MLIQSITSIANDSQQRTADLLKSVVPLLLHMQSAGEESESDADLSGSYRDALNLARTVAGAISRSTLDIRAVVGGFYIFVGPRYDKVKDWTLASLSDAMGDVLSEVTYLAAAGCEAELDVIRQSINGLHAQDARNLAVGKWTIEASEAILGQALGVQRVLESMVT